MRIEGYIYKNPKKDEYSYIAEVPHVISIGVNTVEDGYIFIKEALCDALKEHTGNKIDKKQISVVKLNHNKFDVIFENPNIIMPYILKNLRKLKKLSMQDVCNISGLKYPNSVRQYETGKSNSGFLKFDEIINSLGYDFKIGLIERSRNETSFKQV
jgi:hypothetical protein